jgi:hypothetical protein
MTETKQTRERPSVEKFIQRLSEAGKSGQLLSWFRKFVRVVFNKTPEAPAGSEIADNAPVEPVGADAVSAADKGISTSPQIRESFWQRLNIALGAPRIPAMRKEITSDDQITLTDAKLTVRNTEGPVIDVPLPEIKGVSFESNSKIPGKLDMIVRIKDHDVWNTRSSRGVYGGTFVENSSPFKKMQSILKITRFR